MKNVLFPIICFLFSLQAQAQGDFDYRFYPANIYQKYVERYDQDTVAAKAIKSPTDTTAVPRKLTIDSSKMEVQVVIEKRFEHLTIVDIKFPGVPLYSGNVHFLGLLEDGLGSMLYETEGDQKEQIVVNPIHGFAIVSFKRCFVNVPGGKIAPWAPDPDPLKETKPDFCNFINHNFGNVPVTKYRPGGL